jgi:phosphoenolpyruvate carboxykinase (GTP)
MVSHLAKGSPSSTKFEGQERIADTPLICPGSAPLAPKVRAYVEEAVKLCRPDDVYVCDGSDLENTRLLKLLENQGTIQSLPKYENW